MLNYCLVQFQKKNNVKNILIKNVSFGNKLEIKLINSNNRSLY